MGTRMKPKKAPATSHAGSICVYDTECNLCKKWARWAGKRTDVVFTGPLDLTHRGVDPAEYEEYVVFAGETVERGHKAIAAVLMTMDRPWSWLGKIIDVKVLTPLGRFVYRFVARNRSWLPL